MGHCFTDPRHTLTGLLGCAGRLDDDWSADYRMYDTIDTPRLFEPILQRIRRTIPAEAPRILSATSPSHCDLQQLRAVREMLGDDSHTVVLCGDAHYTTETLLRGLDHDVTYIGRFRKDAALFEAIDADGPCGPGRPRRYGPKRPTPEELRKDKSIPWSEAKIRRGKKLVTIRYKRHAPVTWRPAGEKRTVQVVVIAPLRRGRGKQGQWKYTQPAYLLCTDADLPIESLIETYLIRWGIEVNFREEKQLFGIGQAQVRNRLRVANAPLVALAAYAALTLAGHEAFNEGRNPMRLQTGRWQRRGPTCAYRTSDLRKQLYSEAVLHHVEAFNYHPARIRRSSAIA